MRLARFSPACAFVCLAALLCLVELAVVRSAQFGLNADLLALAITVDLTVGIPVLYYLLLVRTRHGPIVALAPVFIAALLLAHLILPAAQQHYLQRVEYLLPLIEGLALVYAGFEVRAVVRQYRAERPTTVYASDALEAGLRETFGSGRLLHMLVTELSLPFYLVCGWFLRFKPTKADDLAISCYRKSGYGVVVGMFVGLVVLETVGLHLLIQHWSATIAWILTALSCYSLIWIVGDYHAVRLHPLVLGSRTLSLRTGLRWRVDIDWRNIASIKRATPRKQPVQGYLNMAVYGEPRLVLRVKQPVIVHGMFGIHKRVSAIGISVDDEALFEKELHRRVGD